MKRLTPEGLTGAFAWWLSEEITNSNTSQNAYLNNHAAMRHDIFKPVNDLTNMLTSKMFSHHDRFVSWVEAYDERTAIADKDLSAKLIYCSLVAVSGSYRKQNHLEASDQEDYTARRALRPVGIQMLPLVQQEMSEGRLSELKGLSRKSLLEGIVERSLEVEDASMKLHSGIHEWAQNRDESVAGSLAGPEDEPVMAMKEAQELWVGLAAAHVAVAGVLRDGDFAAVPMLSPTSITDAVIFHPFSF